MSVVQPVIKRIPGELPPQPKKSNPGYIEDLKNLQKFALVDLLQRQEKLLADKKFISKLPDKGEKILNFKEKIAKELESRNKIEDAGKLLSRLNIASEGKAAIMELEWTGKYTEKSNGTSEKVVELDSDDEEDALKILAQPTGSGVHKKKVIHVAPEETLIKPEDLEEINSLQTVDSLELDHVKYIINKTENSTSEKKKESFKPYKTTKSNVHDPEKEKERGKKKNKNWEVTAATIPAIVHGAVKQVDMNESLKLLKEHNMKLKEIQTKRAAERLAEHLGTHKIGDLPKNIGHYRSEKDHSDSSSSEEDDYPEVYDEEDNDKAGTVVYTVDTIES